mmetsp:Transcript_27945/g.41429  ORF Transcript_27945/g.41429 Transcript_27945/m.41429 type:complete len:206 (+) Transcript_27945:264-881(+)
MIMQIFRDCKRVDTGKGRCTTFVASGNQIAQFFKVRVSLPHSDRISKCPFAVYNKKLSIFSMLLGLHHTITRNRNTDSYNVSSFFLIRFAKALAHCSSKHIITLHHNREFIICPIFFHFLIHKSMMMVIRPKIINILRLCGITPIEPNAVCLSHNRTNRIPFGMSNGILLAGITVRVKVIPIRKGIEREGSRCDEHIRWDLIIHL